MGSKSSWYKFYDVIRDVIRPRVIKTFRRRVEIATTKEIETQLLAKQEEERLLQEEERLLAEQEEAERLAKQEEERLLQEEERLLAEQQEAERLAKQEEEQALLVKKTRKAQEALTAMELYEGGVDGVAGPGTKSAIVEWQESHDYEATGELSDTQLSELVEETKNVRVALPEYESAPETQFMFVGDDNDVIFLFNETSNAPNGVRDLSGNVVFDDGNTVLCSAFKYTAPKGTAEYIIRQIGGMGVNTSQFSTKLDKCGNVKKTKSDIIVFNRGNALKQSPAKLLPILKMIKEGDLAHFATFDYSTHVSSLEADKERSAQLLDELRQGARPGYGMVVSGQESKVVCSYVSSGSTSADDVAEEFRMGDPILMGGLAEPSALNSVDAVFLALKRNKCGRYIGDGESLALLVAGLDRDGMPYSIHHDWVTQDGRLEIRSTTGTAAVLRMQWALENLGYYSGEVSGNFGPETLQAVSMWQRDKGYQETGELSDDQFAELGDDARAASRAKRSETSSKLAEFQTDPSTKFIFDGHDDDVIYLVNETERAPFALRNLLGEIDFDQGKADVCGLFKFDAGSDAAKFSVGELKKLGAYQFVNGTGETKCGDIEKANSDLIAIRRGDFLRQRFEAVSSVFNQLRSGDLTAFLVSEFETVMRSAEERLVLSQQIHDDILAGNKTGYGLIVIDNGSTLFCAVETTDQDVVDVFAERMNASFDDSRRQSDVKVIFGSLDRSFASLKRKRCAFFFGNAEALKLVSGALSRDGIAHYFHHEWVASAQYTGVSNNIKEEKLSEVREKEERRINEQEAVLLEQETLKATGELAKQQIAEMRRKVGPKARELAAFTKDQIQTYIGCASDVRKDEQCSADLGEPYSTFTKWHTDRRNEQWKFEEIQSVVEDYGLADWKGRNIETVTTFNYIQMINRILGERREACFVFGFVNDGEFQILRQIFVSECDQSGTSLRNWKKQNSFVSQWKLEE